MVGIIASSLTADRPKKPTASRVRDSSWADVRESQLPPFLETD